MWMKSKVFGAKVHSFCASSSSKRQFGGTQRGWMSERSVPMTSAERYGSAKSLSSFSEEFPSEKGINYIAHVPVLVPTSRTFCNRTNSVLFSSDLQISKKSEMLSPGT
jgi:hypothetical protein